MTDRFSVGEIAVLTNMPAKWAHCNGEEVTIMSPLKTHPTAGPYHDVCGEVIKCLYPDGYAYTPLCYLKKRPQPPDWEKLATQNELETV